MDVQFRQLEEAIESQPMPPEFRDMKAWIYCNDCHAKSSVKYHWLGLKCSVCDSYNTARTQIIRASGHSSIPDHAMQVPELSQHAYARSRLVEIVAPSRAANSAPPSGEPLVADGSERRCIRSQDADATNRLPQSPTSVTTSDDESATESESDEEDLDFWGQRSPIIRDVTHGPRDESMPSDSEVDDESQDESDEDDVIYDGEDGGIDEAESEEEDVMDIYGHR
ncbi:MAG: hypothetical protein Q9212_001407 [Teloschistes hypoglaucus]